MSLLFSIIYAHRASGTHHKIAMDALKLMRGPDSTAWMNVCLKHADAYLRGAKAPDDVFRDSMNQVLHVGDNYWGGAEEAGEAWKAKAIELLQAGQWNEAVYALGVLSHYYSDPIQPLHTAQSEAEGNVHRAIEQSIGKSYASLVQHLKTARGGYPEVEAASGGEWVARMIREGAEASYPHYAAMIDHYDLDVGVVDPPAGLDAHLRDVLADCLGRATAGFAVILDKTFAESGVKAPPVALDVGAYLSTLQIPIQWVLRKIEDAQERALVQEMYAEYQATGKTIKTLPHDDRIVRAAYAREVLYRPLEELDAEPVRRPGARHGQAPLPPINPVTAIAVDANTLQTQAAAPVPPRPAAQTPQPGPAVQKPAPQTSDAQRSDTQRSETPRKVRFTLEDPVVDAPAIGPKTAEILESCNIRTVGDLMKADPDNLELMAANKRISAQSIRDWQAMTQLQLDVPEINAIEAQLLVLIGVRDSAALATADAAPLARQIAQFVTGGEGARITRGAEPPMETKVAHWIDAAKKAA
jgi:hypothetical protein